MQPVVEPKKALPVPVPVLDSKSTTRATNLTKAGSKGALASPARAS